MRKPRCRSTSPWVGSSAPLMSVNNVVLPAPLAPTTATRWRVSMRNVTPSRMLSAPKATPTSRRLTRDKRLLPRGTLAGDDAPHDGDRRRVRRVHAEIGEAARAKRPSLRVGGVGCVMDDAEIDGQLGEADRLAGRIADGLGHLIHGVAVWTSLHLDHGERLAVVEVEVAAVLQERPLHADCTLVVEPAAEAQVRGDIRDGEGVVEPVRRAAVLVVNDTADHHVANVGVERGRLAEDVHPAKIDGLGDLAKDVVGGEPKRVID